MKNLDKTVDPKLLMSSGVRFALTCIISAYTSRSTAGTRSSTPPSGQSTQALAGGFPLVSSILTCRCMSTVTEMRYATARVYGGRCLVLQGDKRITSQRPKRGQTTQITRPDQSRRQLQFA